MALEASHIARIDAALAALGPATDAATIAVALGQLLPGVAQRHCEAADVLEEPFRSAPGFDLFLLDASTHCIIVTDVPDEANALLIAAKAGGSA